MSKFFKVLANASKILKYINIFSHVSNGLNVATVALESAIQELYKTNPSFKYLSTLESVLSFVKTVKEAVDTFTEIFGIYESDHVDVVIVECGYYCTPCFTENSLKVCTVRRCRAVCKRCEEASSDFLLLRSEDLLIGLAPAIEHISVTSDNGDRRAELMRSIRHEPGLLSV